MPKGLRVQIPPWALGVEDQTQSGLRLTGILGSACLAGTRRTLKNAQDFAEEAKRILCSRASRYYFFNFLYLL